MAAAAVVGGDMLVWAAGGGGGGGGRRVLDWRRLENGGESAPAAVTTTTGVSGVCEGSGGGGGGAGVTCSMVGGDAGRSGVPSKWPADNLRPSGLVDRGIPGSEGGCRSADSRNDGGTASCWALPSTNGEGCCKESGGGGGGGARAVRGEKDWRASSSTDAMDDVRRNRGCGVGSEAAAETEIAGRCGLDEEAMGVVEAAAAGTSTWAPMVGSGSTAPATGCRSTVSRKAATTSAS